MLHLLSLLPHPVNSRELGFHENYAHHCCQEYYSRVQATGYRDLLLISRLRRNISYSLQKIFWTKPSLWLHYQKFLLHARFMPSVVKLENVAKTLEKP